MDGVLVNPADRLSPQDYQELQRTLGDLMSKFGLAKTDLPKGLQNIPAPFTPVSLDEALAMVRQAYASNSAGIIAFFPKDQSGQRAVLYAPELAPAPNRNNGYFTIHRTGRSKSGILRNFGISVRMADSTEDAKFKVEPGTLLAGGYDVELKEKTQEQS